MTGESESDISIPQDDNPVLPSPNRLGRGIRCFVLSNAGR